MKAIKAELSEDFSSVILYTFSDWHIGDRECDMGAIKNMIETVRTVPNAYVILNGDLMNNATKASVSDSYAEKYSPQEALNLLTDLLRPIKDKILFITSGNHEDRTMKGDGIDLMYCLGVNLDIMDKYCREGGVLFIKFGKGYGRTGKSNYRRPYIYSLYITHGSGGGRKEGGKVNRLSSLSEIVDTDIYIHSHTHLPVIMKENFFRVIPSSTSVTEVTKLYVMTSAALKYGGYGQKGCFRPSATDNPVITLTKDGAIATL